MSNRSRISATAARAVGVAVVGIFAFGAQASADDPPAPSRTDGP